MPVAYLELRRDSRWLSALRRFDVLLDRQRIGRLARGRKCTYEIAPGDHELVIRIDWVTSEPLHFRIAAGQHVRYVCGHPAPNWLAFLMSTHVSSIYVAPDDA